MRYVAHKALAHAALADDGRVLAGILMAQVGEAQGHEVWVDTVFLQQAAELGNANPQGIKCRFGHPTPCYDNTGKVLGKFFNLRVEGDKLLGDLKLFNRALVRDEVEALLDAAKTDDGTFAMSVHFRLQTHVVKIKQGENEYEEERPLYGEPDNPKGLKHVRMGALYACDAVDMGATTGTHLYSATVADMDEMFDDVLGSFTPLVQQYLAARPERAAQIRALLDQAAPVAARQHTPAPQLAAQGTRFFFSNQPKPNEVQP